MEQQITIYSKGLISMSVCAHKSMTIAEIERQANIINPTGIESKWKLSENETFADGSSNPCQCEKDRNQMHYLLTC